MIYCCTFSDVFHFYHDNHILYRDILFPPFELCPQ